MLKNKNWDADIFKEQIAFLSYYRKVLLALYMAELRLPYTKPGAQQNRYKLSIEAVRLWLENNNDKKVLMYINANQANFRTMDVKSHFSIILYHFKSTEYALESVMSVINPLDSIYGISPLDGRIVQARFASEEELQIASEAARINIKSRVLPYLDALVNMNFPQLPNLSYEGKLLYLNDKLEIPILESQEDKFRLNFWDKEYEYQIIDTLENIAALPEIQRILDYK